MYKLVVNEKTKREMWFKDGKLVGAAKVPETEKSRLRAPEIAKEKPKIEKNPALEGVKLEGFADEQIIDNASINERNAKESKAVEVLSERFPEFDFEVKFTPKKKRGNEIIKARYTIQFYADKKWQGQMMVHEWNMESIRARLETVLNGPPTPSNPNPRYDHVKAETVSQGTRTFSA